MKCMRIDHVCYAAGPDGMERTAERFAQRLGVGAHHGGVHPTFGTRNMILPLAQERYLEVVEVLDHPASDKAPFGRAVRSRSEQGGGWLAWVIATDDLSDVEQRLGREAVPGHRHTPEGIELSWRQVGITSTMADPALPFFIRWDDVSHHPSRLDHSGVRLTGLSICGDQQRVRQWLGLNGTEGGWEQGIEFDFDPGDRPALEAVSFQTPVGERIAL